MSTRANDKKWGLLAQYENPHAIFKACEQVRDAGYSRWDSCTPFPVHGLEKAMGLRPSVLPWVVLVTGIAGSSFMLWFQIWTSTTAYPLVVGGQPLFSLPSFVPIWYEVTVLASCLAAFFGNWVLSGLPRLHHPAFASRAFARVTDDKFFILVESSDPKFALEQTTALLKASGATLVEELEN